MVTRRYTIHPPQLQGRSWEESAQELQRFLRYLMDANDSGQAGAGISGVVGGTIDHGSIAGLADDDHTQYLKEKLSGGLAAEVPAHAHTSGAEAGQLDHGLALTGLTDDDHTQYLKEKLSGGLAAEVPAHTHADANNAGQVDHGTANDAASLLDNDHPLYQRKHGFELSSSGAALQTITYDKTTRKITVTPTGATFRFWVDGVQFIKTGAQESDAHGLTTGKYFLKYDNTGTLVFDTAGFAIRDRSNTMVALVYWNNTLSDGWAFFECHTADRTLEQHYHDHFSQGTKYISGGDLTGYTLTTDTEAGITFAIADATVADEDIVRVLDAVADGGPYCVLYRSGAGSEWEFVDTLVRPYQHDGGANYVAYNNPNAGGAGVWGLSSAGGGNFVVYYLLAAPSIQANRQFFLVPDQAATGTLAQAQARSVSQLSWGSLPFEEATPLYKIIFRTGAGYGTTGRGRIEQIDSLRAGVGVLSVTGGGVTDHGGLSGLLDDDHTQYQLRSEEGVASGYPSLDAGVAVVQAVKLVRQGLVGALPALAEGELYWATDTDTLYIGT